MMIGRKLGMSQKFLENGTLVPVTVLLVEDHYVVDKKLGKLLLGTFPIRAKLLKRPQREFLKKHNLPMLRIMKEFPWENVDQFEVGQTLGVDQFQDISFVDVTATTKGRGFTGVIKRHNFKSGRASHGNSVTERSHGSTGNRQDPGRVFKNKKMAGHYGNERCTVQNLSIVEVCPEDKLLIVKGAVPGPQGGVVFIKKAVKKGA